MNELPYRLDVFRHAVTGRLLEALTTEKLAVLWDVVEAEDHYDLSLWVLPNVLVDSEGEEPPRVRVPPYRFDFYGLREVFDTCQAFHLANIAEPLLDVDYTPGEDDRGVRLAARGTYHGQQVRFVFFAQRRHDRYGLVVYYREGELLSQREYDPEYDRGLFK